MRAVWLWRQTHIARVTTVAVVVVDRHEVVAGLELGGVGFGGEVLRRLPVTSLPCGNLRLPCAVVHPAAEGPGREQCSAGRRIPGPGPLAELASDPLLQVGGVSVCVPSLPRSLRLTFFPGGVRRPQCWQQDEVKASGQARNSTPSSRARRSTCPRSLLNAKWMRIYATLPGRRRLSPLSLRRRTSCADMAPKLIKSQRVSRLVIRRWNASIRRFCLARSRRWASSAPFRERFALPLAFAPLTSSLARWRVQPCFATRSCLRCMRPMKERDASSLACTGPGPLP